MEPLGRLRGTGGNVQDHDYPIDGENKMMRMRAWMVGGSLLALTALLWLEGRGVAGDDEKAQHAQIQKIAAAFKTSKEEGSKMSAAMGKKLESLEGIMHGFKLRKKGGIGVGKTAGAITPDGIEHRFNALLRDGITATALGKEAEAIEEMAYVTAAIGEVTKNFETPGLFKGKKTKKDWQAYSDRMVEGSLKLAAAAKAKNAPEVKTAAKTVNDACNACHSLFRE